MENKNNIFPRLILAAVILVVVLIYTEFNPPVRKIVKFPEPCSNQKIIEYYKSDFKEWRTAYNEIADAFDEINTDSALIYSCMQPRHRLYTITWQDITDKYPNFKKVMLKWLPDESKWPYRNWQIRASNHILFWNARDFMRNLDDEHTYYIYTRKSEKELLEYLKGYKIVNYVPKDTCTGWLYRLDKNWYICSPDTHTGFESYNISDNEICIQ